MLTQGTRAITSPQKDKLVNAGKHMEKMHCWQEGKVTQPLYKTAWILLKNKKTDLLNDLAIPLWKFTQKNGKQHLKELSFSILSPAVLLQLNCKN